MKKKKNLANKAREAPLPCLTCFALRILQSALVGWLCSPKFFFFSCRKSVPRLCIIPSAVIVLDVKIDQVSCRIWPSLLCIDAIAIPKIFCRPAILAALPLISTKPKNRTAKLRRLQACH